VADPRQPGRRLAVVKLRDRALGTSGGQFQSFRHQGRRYGHILDPRSGWPAEGVLSVTVVAPSAALADALSTAFYVLGPQPSLDYCRVRPEIGMVMLCPGGRGGKVEIHGIGLGPQEVTMCDV
jgi:thiamine biosynthesis lipoprotein